MTLDPLSGAAANVGVAAANEGLKGVSGLLQRALGPTCDVLGEHWAEQTQAWLRGNQTRVLEGAAEKSERFGRSGPANLRSADKILREAATADNELLAEYFSGLLAGSRTVDGRDDRAVAWTALVSSLSSIQIRLHFMLYREWAVALHGRVAEFPLMVDTGRAKATAEMAFFVTVPELTSHGYTSGPGAGHRFFSHAVHGLSRQGLIGGYGYGDRKGIGRESSKYQTLFWAEPTVPGIELFGWALGVPAMDAIGLLSLNEVPDTDPPTPRLSTFTIPALESEPQPSKED